LKQAQLEMVRLENAIAELRTQEKEHRLEQQVQLRAALNQLRSSLAQWEKSYVLSAPVEGQISFLQPLKEGGFTEGDALIVTPKEKHFYGSLNVPFTGAGKVVPGQQVIIKLTDYPYREYGVLTGRLTELAPVAGESHYLGKVNIQTASRSSFDKTINLKENMSGTAEIVTHDRHLLGRLFEKVIYAFKR
jgi:HlyD family secretion protein